jgi:hypothetical protein
MERMERIPEGRRSSRLTRVLAAIGRGALLMAGGAGVLWIGAAPHLVGPPEEDDSRSSG